MRTLAKMLANIRALRRLGYSASFKLKGVCEVMNSSGMIIKQKAGRLEWFDLG